MRGARELRCFGSATLMDADTAVAATAVTSALSTQFFGNVFDAWSRDGVIDDSRDEPSSTKASQSRYDG